MEELLYSAQLVILLICLHTIVFSCNSECSFGELILSSVQTIFLAICLYLIVSLFSFGYTSMELVFLTCLYVIVSLCSFIGSLWADNHIKRNYRPQNTLLKDCIFWISAFSCVSSILLFPRIIANFIYNYNFGGGIHWLFGSLCVILSLTGFGIMYYRRCLNRYRS